MGGAGLGHCAPLVADPRLLSTGGCIHVAAKALSSSSACPGIPILHPPAVWAAPAGPQLILPSLEHLAGLRIQAQVVPRARQPGPRTNPGLPELRTRMPDFLPVVEGGPQRRSKTRAPGSHTQERRQPRALWCWLQCSPGGCSSHHRCCHLPALLSVLMGHTQGLSLGFPTQEQPWEVGGGNGSAPCSRCFLSALCALDFFLSWQQEQLCHR